MNVVVDTLGCGVLSRGSETRTNAWNSSFGRRRGWSEVEEASEGDLD